MNPTPEEIRAATARPHSPKRKEQTMTQQHTPGRWRIANNGKKGRESETYRIWRNDEGPDSEDTETNTNYACIAAHVHGKGNARLIAAAPELLEALSGLLDDFKAYVDDERDADIKERNQAWLDMASAAIEKATGLSE